MVLERRHSYSTLASPSKETHPHQKSNWESPHTFIFRSRDLLSWHQARQVAVSRLSKDSSTSLAVRNISIFTRSLEEGAAQVTTCLWPTSRGNWFLPSSPQPPNQNFGLALLYPCLRFNLSGALLIESTQGIDSRSRNGPWWLGSLHVADAYWLGEPDPSCCNKERSTRIITRLL